MKKLFFFLSISAFAQVPQHWVNLENPKTLYLSKEFCPGECLPVMEKDHLIGAPETLEAKEVSEEVCASDMDKPIFSRRSQIESCDGVEACQKILREKRCTSGEVFINEKSSEVYCAKRTGFEQKCETVKSRKLFVNEKKKAEKDRLDLEWKEAAEAKAKEKVEREERIKKFDFKSAKSVEELAPILKDLRDSLAEGK